MTMAGAATVTPLQQAAELLSVCTLTLDMLLEQLLLAPCKLAAISLTQNFISYLNTIITTMNVFFMSERMPRGPESK